MHFIELLPTAWVWVVIVLVMLSSCELGYQLGYLGFRNKEEGDGSSSLGPMVGGLLGMLGFVLAFSFSMAAGQHQTRKENVLLEANVIGTAYLRTDLLPEAAAGEVRDLLRRYVETRLRAAEDKVVFGEEMEAIQRSSVVIHEALWHQVVSVAKQESSPTVALMVQATNELIDMHEQRATGSYYNRIPTSVWIALLVICALTMMTLGTQVGMTGRRRLSAVVPLSLAFSLLVTLIVDLDRPQRGLIQVDQHAMYNLYEGMGGDLEALISTQ
ncbi:bestrophin-like domain [Ferrimonas marina]|uniref:DUF4239 domain-containing protein n=1 Tax=Ferrimonas marina TaxID=299255 RepID=A0A1M5NZ40_9GAMM|nr:DUF4239 domain-containing protein [Ferrimonas marina]SHG94243.1 Protein of unknown function [Ferrimonas marina]